MSISKLEFVKAQKQSWNKKTEINIGDNQLYKIIGIGPKAFKVLWFGKTKGSTKPIWNQCWWNYKELDDTAKTVVDKMYSILSGGQSTL